MNKGKLLLLLSGLFLLTQAQAAANVEGMSSCMMQCKGEQRCVNTCASNNAPRGVGKEILACLSGCGLGISSQGDDASIKDHLKACLKGCLDTIH